MIIWCGRWPKTLAGILAFLPCAPATFGSAPHPSGRASNPSRQREKKAWRHCDRTGRWAEEDYTQCPYASELTRVLHELNQVWITLWRHSKTTQGELVHVCFCTAFSSNHYFLMCVVYFQHAQRELWSDVMFCLCKVTSNEMKWTYFEYIYLSYLTDSLIEMYILIII